MSGGQRGGHQRRAGGWGPGVLPGCEVSFKGESVCQPGRGVAAQPRESTEHNPSTHFKMAHLMLCECFHNKRKLCGVGKQVCRRRCTTRYHVCEKHANNLKHMHGHARGDTVRTQCREGPGSSLPRCLCGEQGNPAKSNVYFMFKIQKLMLLCIGSEQWVWVWLYFPLYFSVCLKDFII